MDSVKNTSKGFGGVSLAADGVNPCQRAADGPLGWAGTRMARGGTAAAVGTVSGGGTVCPAAARALDQFYTRPEVAAACVAWALAEIGAAGGPPPALWVEPSAGGGAFLHRLPRPRMGIDVSPGAPDVARADFLSWLPPPGLGGPVAVVGNPPFGRNASLAVRFFNRAASFAEWVAFVVPRTFQKESLLRRLDPRMRLVAERPLPPGSFTLAGAVRDVPCVFQVWRRLPPAAACPHRPPPRPRAHPDFAFTTADRASVAVQRVGARAGRASVDGLRKSPSSHYFLRPAPGVPAAALLAALARADWSGLRSRTAGNPSVSKGDVVAAYEAGRRAAAGVGDPESGLARAA